MYCSEGSEFTRIREQVQHYRVGTGLSEAASEQDGLEF